MTSGFFGELRLGRGRENLMGDYNFHGLSARSFEQMIQALAIKILGPGVIIFGDGPDGGREATFQGHVKDFPSKGNSWDGYIVVQAKFCQEPKFNIDDTTWALNNLKKELDDYSNTKKKRIIPDYYIFVTNISLSPVPTSGGKDKLSSLLEPYHKKLKMKDYRIWDYDQLCRFLDADADVRNSYYAWITPGDVLAAVISKLQFDSPSFSVVMNNFLQKELLEDQYSKLEQAGHSPDNRIFLENVFIDLPCFPERRASSPEEEDPLPPGFISQMIDASSLRLSPLSVEPAMSIDQMKPFPGRYVLIGGPGQGKSTLGQYLCQIHRASLLRRSSNLAVDAQIVIQSIINRCSIYNLSISTARRFPIRIELARFAKELAMKKQTKVTSVLAYIASKIFEKTDYTVTVTDMRKWLQAYPWLVVFDGLDEVPSSTNRPELLSSIRSFLVDIAGCSADVLILATTRPQGYNEEFSTTRYKHLWLAPLSISRALHYGHRLTECTYPDNAPRIQEINGRLTNAAEIPATARLMESPLQVTIMARLLAQFSQPPQERYRLFQQYYEVIYRREMERDVEPLSAILRDYKADIDSIHQSMGLILQCESEKTRHTDATMSHDNFIKVVGERLYSEGHRDDKLKDLTKNISSCATNRLVFLVPSQNARVGFEIRSLQEFMAAESLMDAKDNVAIDRLKAIAPIPYWHNVFLFAAGRVFADRQWLRDSISNICSEIESDTKDPLSCVTRAGTRLAISLLEDGPARRQPTYSAALARKALNILYSPPESYTKILADIFDPDLEMIYLDEIIKHLKSFPIENQLHVWNLIINLLSRNITWAKDLANKYWPVKISDQVRIIDCYDFDILNDWLAKKISSIFFRTDSLRHSFIYSCREYDSAIDDKVRLFCEYLNYNPKQHNTVHTLWKSLDIHITFIRDIRRSTFHFEDEIKSCKKPWLPILESIRFMTDPNHHNLASTLRAFADYPNYHTFAYKYPWPLTACLRAGNTKSKLVELAVNVDAGHLGTYEDWKAAEERWDINGLTEQDLAYMSDDKWPFAKSIAEVGFPLNSAIFVSKTNFTNDANQILHHVCNMTYGNKCKSYFATKIIRHLSESSQRTKINILLKKFFKHYSLDDDLDYFDYRYLNFITNFCLTYKRKNAMTILNKIGNNVNFIFYTPNFSQLDIKNIHNTYKLLARAFARERSKTGILRLISKIAADFKVPIVDELSYTNKILSAEYSPLAVINLTNPNIDKASAEHTADCILEFCHVRSDVVLDSLRCFSKHQVLNTRGHYFLLRLNEKLSPDYVHEKRYLISLMQDYISRRTARLDDRDVWTRLGLPHGLHSLIAS
jgi:hypothetical protein